MKVEVALLPRDLPEPLGPRDLAVVIDVVRATSFTGCALAAGAEGVQPAAEVDEARQLAARADALLAGERGGLPPEGFDLGNSPRELEPARIAGRRLVLTTTNGTAAVRRCAGAAAIHAASLLNAEAAVRVAVRSATERGLETIWLVCAGSSGELALDDVAAAGCMVGQFALESDAALGESGRLAAAYFDRHKTDLRGVLAESSSGRKLVAVGLAADLDLCARVDAHDFGIVLAADGCFRREEG